MGPLTDTLELCLVELFSKSSMMHVDGVVVHCHYHHYYVDQILIRLHLKCT